MRRLSVRLRPEAAAAVDEKAEELGISKNAALHHLIMAPKWRQSGAKPSRAREKLRFCIKEKNIIEPLLSPRGYEEHPFFNEPAFKSSWETYEQVREEMGKKISRQIAAAILAACEDMGIDKAKVALNRAAQGGHTMVIPPPDPKEKPRWAETEEEREERELYERCEARRRKRIRRNGG